MRILICCGLFIGVLSSLSCLAQPLGRFPAFEGRSRPAGKLSGWEWAQGDGELVVGADKELILRANSPPPVGDNRVGALVDSGNGNCESFVLDISVDPASNIQGSGYNQLDFGVTVGLSRTDSNPSRFQASHGGLSLNIRDLYDVADYGVFLGGRDLSLPVPVSSGTGNPRAFNRHDGFYQFRMIVTPSGRGSLIRVFHTQFVTPDWEATIPERIAAGRVGMYARLGQQSGKVVESTIAAFSLRPIDPRIAKWQPTDAESVLYSLNLNFPGLEGVKAALEKRDVDTATTRLANYLRLRKNVVGPSVATEPLSERDQRVADLMTEDKLLVYTGGPLFEHKFDSPYDWAVDPYQTGGQFAIYNSRMFPWIEMGRAYQKTGDGKYARTFVRQLNSWLDQIPLKIIAKPGGSPFFIDGNTLEPPLRFTGNMGRRIELTWWQAFELFKNAPELDDHSLIRMMKYFQDNARLVTNPSVFLAWDDSGLHMATGLLQCATMMPEWKESRVWNEVAFNRLEQTFRSQVHEDGTHASLSTGYGWATIESYRNVFEIMRRNDLKVPPKFVEAIRGMIMSYMGILRPNFGNISLNDGGWSHVDDKVREYSSLFPGDDEIAFFGSRGSHGKAPIWKSRYFPNAGWYVMRTGYGQKDKYLFMDGGPFGASHGKQDSLHLIVACGSSLLLRDGGRGDYTQKATSRWTAQTLAFNTLTPDWALQDRTHRYDHEKYAGMTPPNRPWVTNDEFDYGRSFYDAGWFLQGKKIGGRHARHVIFLKGKRPPETGYWIVIDQVVPDDRAPRTWRHPWHLSTEAIELNESKRSFTCAGGDANLQIVPVDPEKNMILSVVKGQREPQLQGWKVLGAEAMPAATPMYAWPASGPFTKAWVLLPRLAKQRSFEIVNVSVIESSDAKLSFSLERTDGGRDYVVVAKQSGTKSLGEIAGRVARGSLVVIRVGTDAQIEAVLEVK